MKKIVIGIICLLTIAFSGCSTWDMSIKNWKTETVPILRYVKVYDSISGETLFEGDYYIYAKTSESKIGDFSLLIKTEDGTKKLDFYGNHIGLIMIEK